MSRNYYCEIYLHLTWHTKTSSPLLTPEVEPFTHQALRQRIIDTPGAYVHEIGGTETHVHLAVGIPPDLSISEWIGQLKGGSAHDVNHKAGRGQKILEWQPGYGVVTFGKGDLEWVCAYIQNQREHHAKGSTQIRLERFAPEETR